MSWWHEAPYWLREVTAMFGTFFVVTFGIIFLAWLTDRARWRGR